MRPARGAGRTWGWALAAALLFLGWNRAVQWRAFHDQIAAAAQGRPAPPARDARSPTGHAGGVRDQILQPGDSYHWVMQTQQMLADGALRVRHVDYDNAPQGRDAHWSSAMRWWLAGVAWVHARMTGEPLPVAVERAAVYANALLLPLLLAGIVPVLAWRFGAWPASLAAIAMVTLGAWRAEFGIGVFDHHGAAAACALLLVVFAAAGGAGWVRDDAANARAPVWLPSRRAARRWLAASAISGGVGLWLSASTLVPVLAATGGALLIGLIAARRGSDDKSAAMPAPELWRAWGLLGAATSLLAYAVEHAPGPFPLRLEVNHPLYALAWACGGDLLCRVGRAASGTHAWRAPRALAGLAADAAGIAAPGIVVLGWGASVFAVADPVLWVHRGFISEFASAVSALREAPARVAGTFLLRDVTLLPLLVAPAAWWWRKPLPPGVRAGMLLALGPALGATLLGLQQIRWLSLAAALWIAALVVLAHLRLSLLGRFPWRAQEKPLLAILLAAVFLPLPFDAFAAALRRPAAAAPPKEVLRAVAARDLAHALRERTAGQPFVVASAASTATDLIYFGGAKGIGTFYWENRAGLRAAFELHGARTAEAAHAVLQRHGVTHWVVFSWDDFRVMSTGFAEPPPRSAPAEPPAAFLLNVLRGREPLPPWARPLPFALPWAERLPGDWVLVLEIAAPGVRDP